MLRRGKTATSADGVTTAIAASPGGAALAPYAFDLPTVISTLTLHDASFPQQNSVVTLKRKSDGREEPSSDYLPKRARLTTDSQKRVAFFNDYSDLDGSKISSVGMERLCADLRLHPSSAVMLILAWVLEAKEMCVFTRSEWLSGLAKLQCDDLHSLRQCLPNLEGLLKQKSVLAKIYRYAFDFTCDPGQRSIEMDSAIEMLTIIFGHRYVSWPLLESFAAFLKRCSYRGINRDQWYNILDFADNIPADMASYDESGAWPVLIDEFVAERRTELGLPPFQGTGGIEINKNSDCHSDEELDMEL